MKKYIIFIMLIFGYLKADILWVDCECADTTGTGTEASPFKFISQIRHTLAANDTVMVKGSQDSTYDEADYSVIWGKTVGWGFPNGHTKTGVILQGYGLVPPIIECSVGTNRFIINAYNLTIKNVIFGTITQSSYIQWLRGTLTLIDVILNNATTKYLIEDEYDASGLEYFYAYNCIFYLNAHSGLLFTNSVTGVFTNSLFTFDHCLIHDNGKNNTGIWFSENTSTGISAVFKNCIIDIDSLYKDSPAVGNLYTFENCFYDIDQVEPNATFTNCWSYDVGTTAGANHPHYTFSTTIYWNTILNHSPVFGKATDFLQVGPIFRSDGAGIYLGRQSP